MLFNNAVAESITIFLASISVLYKLYLSSSNTALPLGLAACIGISAALTVLAVVSPLRVQQRVADISPHERTTPCTSATAEHEDPSKVESSVTPLTFSHPVVREEYQLEDNAGVPKAANTTSTAAVRQHRNGLYQTPSDTRGCTAAPFGHDRDTHQDCCSGGHQPTPIGEVRTKAPAPAPATATAKARSKNGPVVSGFGDKGNGYLHAHVSEEHALPSRTEATHTVAGVAPSRPITSPCIARISNRRRREYCDDPLVAGGVGRETCGVAGNLMPPPKAEIVLDVAQRLGFGVLGGLVKSTRCITWAGFNAGAEIRTGVARGGRAVAADENNPEARSSVYGGVTGIGGKRELVASKRYLQPSAFDGLAVGVATVPVVLSSALLLCELKSVNTVRESGGSVVEELTVEELDRSDWVEYLGTVLEGSLMCAVWEVMSALQRVFGGRERRRRPILRRVVLNSLVQVAVLVSYCVQCFRRPLLPLCCLVIFDIIHRALAFGDGNVMRRLSLRSGEASILAHALALWIVDACLYFLQELWLPDPSAWDWLFPRAPYRSSSMVVVQTGIIGTLVTGLAMTGARQLMPSAWASDARGHSVSCAVLAGGTAAWLLTWTAPLLGMNPVTWAVLYALGVPSERAKAMVLGKAQESVKLWSFAAEWPGWAKSAIWRYRRSWSSSTATLETCTGVVLRGGIDQSRPLLVAWWFLALAVVVPVTPWVSRWLSLSKTAARKIFHALATAMFVPAIYLEPEFLSLAIGTALGIFLALEFVRCTGCTPVSRALDRYYGGFLDARDGGRVVVTHLFLLLGCAVPVWLSELVGESGSVLPYAGVVVLGVGDAMGAVVGSSVGRLHWPGSRRTLEGSIAVFLSSLMTLVLISLFMIDGASSVDVNGLARAVTSLAWPVTVASLMEAFTSQVDNLVLPCVLFSCLALRDV